MIPTELIAVLVKPESGREELRFVPTCRGCGKPVLDFTAANVAVVGGTSEPPSPLGTFNGARVSRLDGRAFVFCWNCDREQDTDNVPWQNAAATFRSDRTQRGASR